MKKEVRGFRKIVTSAADRDRDDRHAGVDGGDHLEQAPRPAEDLDRLHDGQHVAVPDVVQQLTKVLLGRNSDSGRGQQGTGGRTRKSADVTCKSSLSRKHSLQIRPCIFSFRKRASIEQSRLW